MTVLRPCIRLVGWCILLAASSSAASPPDMEKILDDLGWEGQIGQMAQIDVAVLLNDDKSDLDPVKLDRYIGELGVGSVLNNVPWDHKKWKASDFRHAVIQVQACAQEHGRPPVVWGLDSVHGADYIYDAVLSPQPLNLAATFNTSLSYKAGVWASRDTRKAGIPWLFSPLLGLSWNSFWSRTYETFGEDPLLVGDMAKAMVEGIQDTQPGDNILPSKAAACGKHWLGYSFPHNGHDRAPSWIPRRHLYQYFLQPWRKVVQSSAPLLTIMESYTEVDGVPNVANRETLTKILRRELGFEGMLVTDYHEIFNLAEWHRTAKDRNDALKQSMEEGSVDMSMIANEPDDFFEGMKALDSKVYGTRIRESARRVLELKQNLNMFEESFDLKPLPEDDKPAKNGTTISPQDLQAALEMTQQSIVLTENKNGALPLNPKEELKILVTGPTSKSISFQSGGWTGQWQGVDSNNEEEWFTYGSTVFDAVQTEASSNGAWRVTYECGTDILGNDCQAEDAGNNNNDQNQNLLDTVEEWVGWKDGHHESIQNAANQAKNADVVIVCLGEENNTEKPGDIRDLRLPTGQYELVAGIRSAAPDKKIVLVFFGGRPRLLEEVASQVDAVLIGFLPGPLAGDAVTGIVSGRVNPSGRLPITYPKYQDLGGVPYLHAVSDMCTEGQGALPHYNNVPCEVQWPFGHGLEYTKFEYGHITLSTDVLQHRWNKKDNADLTVSVTVTNRGDMAGATTILFFTFDEFRSTTPEYKRLRAYEKIWLETGASKEVKVTIPLEDFRFVGPHDDSHYILQDGLVFRVGVGTSADCRAGAESARCSGPITIKTENNYVAACEAACNVWEQSGCNVFTPESCHKECSSIHDQDQNGIQLNNDGWGWTYVSCLESLVLNEAWHPSSCWKMTAFCRDVVTTPGMDEFGAGTTPRHFAPAGGSNTAVWLSLFAGVFASAMIYLSPSIKGRFSSSDRHSRGEFNAVAAFELV